MYVNIAVLRETLPHERRVALVPSITAEIVKLGGKLHMQTGAGEASSLPDSSYKDVVHRFGHQQRQKRSGRAHMSPNRRRAK